ncbi:hypothetical protein [Azospirillum argentinense]|uniref:hypothetical protein n=1 Tax=Azospirillum argentinense TaxID=2970906 RepID=UPI00136240CC|nr:hypothetical protein [Azospirillum argentinense]
MHQKKNATVVFETRFHRSDKELGGETDGRERRRPQRAQRGKKKFTKKRFIMTKNE